MKNKVTDYFGAVLSVSRGIALGLAASTMLVGCASAPRPMDTGERGLFQANQNASESVSEQTIESVNREVRQRLDAGLAWPIQKGSVSSYFGNRRRDFHEGIDIRANRGSPIFAAKDGLVIYSSRKIRGYGNMIVIKHDDGLSTVYAHNKKNLVKRGDRVARGQLVGYVGATGKATGPHLHFEVRKGEAAEDPLIYLPELRSPAVARK